MLAGFDCTQHLLGNVVVDIDGDDAHATCYLQAQHVLGGDVFTVGGTYRDRISRTPDGWRIAERRLEPVWQTGDAGLVAIAAGRSAPAETA